MDEEKAFLATLRACPADDTARLVYADWLEERGDCRGEFLRVAVAARTAAITGADLHRQLHRLDELRPAVAPEWILQAYPSLAEDDVREVVFLELAGHGEGGDTFLRVENEQDPSPYLFALVARRREAVHPASRAEQRDSRYFHKLSDQTDSQGTLVSIDGLVCAGENLWHVNGTWFQNPMNVRGDVYRVGVRHGRWAILAVSSQRLS